MNIEFIKFLHRLDIPAEYKSFIFLSTSIGQHVFANGADMEVAIQFSFEKAGNLSPIIHLQLRLKHRDSDINESFYYANSCTMTKAQKTVNERMAKKTYLHMLDRFPYVCKNESQFIFRLFDLCGLSFLRICDR